MAGWFPNAIERAGAGAGRKAQRRGLDGELSASLRIGRIEKSTAHTAYLGVLLVREEDDIEMLAGVENRRERRTDLRRKTAFIRALRLDAEPRPACSMTSSARLAPRPWE